MLKKWRNQNLHLVIVSVFTILYFVFFSYTMLVHGRLENYLRDWNIDDSFYYFKIAQNFANGHFSTFDGINTTNGYHPLWGLIIVPIFYFVTSIFDALIAIKIFELFLLLISALLLIQSFRLLKAPIYFAVGLALSILSLTVLYIGMEAGLYFFMLTTLLWSTLSFIKEEGSNQKSNYSYFILLFTVFLLPFARLESIAITGSVSVLLWFASQINAIPKKLSAKLIILFCISLGGFLFYLILQKILFGIYIPVSGLIKQNILSAHLFRQEGGFNLIENGKQIFKLMPIAYGLKVSAISIVVALIGLLIEYRCQNTVALSFHIIVLALVLGHVSKAVQSATSIHPMYAGYTWYFVPAFLLSILLPVYTVSTIYSLLPKKVWLKRIGFAVGCITIIWLAPIHSNQSLLRSWQKNQIDDWEIRSFQMTQLLNASLSSDLHVGSHDSGVIGYFSNEPVINLDGLANSTKYYQAILAGNTDRLLKEFSLSLYVNLMSNDSCYEKFCQNKEVIFRGPLLESTNTRVTALFIDPAIKSKIIVKLKQFKYYGKIDNNNIYYSNGILIIQNEKCNQLLENIKILPLFAPVAIEYRLKNRSIIKADAIPLSKCNIAYTAIANPTKITEFRLHLAQPWYSLTQPDHKELHNIDLDH